MERATCVWKLLYLSLGVIFTHNDVHTQIVGLIGIIHIHFLLKMSGAGRYIPAYDHQGNTSVMHYQYLLKKERWLNSKVKTEYVSQYRKIQNSANNII